jgi:hypothetical protein
MVVVVDDEDRENEGDLIMAAAKVTPEAVNFMIRHARGLVCAPLTAKRVCELDLPPDGYTTIRIRIAPHSPFQLMPVHAALVFPLLSGLRPLKR